MQGLSGLALAGTRVCWTNQGGAVMQAPSAGGSPTTIAIEPYPTTGIASDGSNVYWATWAASGGSILKAPLGGGPSVALSIAYQANAVAVDASNVYWTEDSRVSQAPIAGGTRLSVATGKIPYGIALDGSSVYWTDMLDGKVLKSQVSTGASTPPDAVVLAAGQVQPTFLVADGVSVYFSTINAIMRVPAGGGAPAKIASDQASGMAIDGSFVYWTSPSGEVVRIPK